MVTSAVTKKSVTKKPVTKKAVTNTAATKRAATSGSTPPGTRLRLDPTVCRGHGVCAELLAEHISLDEWGYPIIADRPVPADLLRDARRAVTDCPALALRLEGR